MYQIKVLNDKEFRKVSQSDPRYANVDETNLGFADPVKNTAYVRFTAYPDLTKYLVDHEFEHLIEEHGTDQDEYGIRHKKKRGFMDWFIPIITGGVSKLFDTGPVNKSEGGLGDFFGGGGQQETPQVEAPQVSNQYMQNQTGQTSSVGTMPEVMSQGVMGSLNQGGLQTSSQSGIPADLIDRIKGFYQGRIPF